MKLTTNFNLVEFVPKAVYDKFGDKAIWYLIWDHVLAMQWMRDNMTKDFGRNIQLVVNDWADGGSMHFRGLRTEDAKSFKPWSMHSYKCGATDWSSPNATVKEMWDWMMHNQKRILAETSIRAVEDITATPTWIHGDSRTILNPTSLLIVKP